MAGAPVTFAEDDPARAEKEAHLRALDDAALEALYRQTRRAARQAKETRDMERLYALVRGTKTIQRIADERGLVIRAKR